MNKKEVAEIKKQFTPTHCAISRICGCYVDGDKNKLATFQDAFLSLPEEEIAKYFEIFRKSLSGTLGKNLLNMEFPLSAEEEGAPQDLLMQLRASGLKDDALLEKYYDAVIESYDYGENYLILLVHSAYDIPGKASDQLDMDDASDEVYTYILSCICPVSLAKPALSYDASDKTFHGRVRDWIVDMPHLGFLFPAFNDRSTDIHNLLYYSKDADDLHFTFTDRMLGCTLPLPATSQKEIFSDIIEQTLGEECSYDIVQNLHEQIHELTVQQKDSPDPIILDQDEVKNLLEQSGANPEQMARFEKCIEEVTEQETKPTFLASNLSGARKYQVSTPDIVIQVSPDRADLVEQQIIDGRPCLVIPITDDITVNGIRVKPTLPQM